MNRIESPSSISTYIKCPRRYQYIYENGYKRGGSLYTELGKSFHKTMEHFYEIYYNNIETFTVKMAMQESIIKYWNPTIGTCFSNDAIKMFDNYVSYLLRDDNLKRPMYCEKNLEGRFITITDRIDEDKIVDYKTSNKFTKKPDIFNRIQAVMNYLNIKDVLNITIPIVEFHYVRFMDNEGRGIQKIEITDQLIDEVLNIINTIEENTKNEFYPKLTTQCFFCDYSKICESNSAAIDDAIKKVFI